MAAKSKSNKKSGSSRSSIEAGDKDRIIVELNNRIAVLENELRSKQENASSVAVTERKRAENTWQMTPDELRACVLEKNPIFDIINVAIAFHDAENNFVWANKAYMSYVSVPMSELKGRKCYACWGLDRLCLTCPVFRAIRTGEPQEGELTPENQPHWPANQGSWLVRAAPVKDSTGKVIGVFEVAQNITERKRAEDALRESERQLAEGQKLTSTGSWEMDLATGEIKFSDNMFHILDFPQGRHSYEEFRNRVHPEDRERGDAAIKDTIDNGKMYYMEYRIVLSDKSLRHIHAIGRLARDSGGKPVKLMATIQDITEHKYAEEALKESEEKYRIAADMQQLIINNIPEGIFWKDCSSTYLGCNNIFAMAVGLTSAGEIVGKTDYDLPWTPEQTASYQEYDRRIMENDVPEYGIVEQLRDMDGKLSCVETNKVPLHDVRGNVIGILGTYQDITERKQAEETLKDAKQQAELYVDLMGHDINNMNHSAMGYLELALELLESEKRLRLDDKMLIERPIRVLANSSALISNVRKLQRLIAEGVKTKPTDLHEIFRGLEAMPFDLHDRDVMINIQHIPGIMVEANELLKDVFVNLIANAIKHSNEEKPLTINVKVEPVNENSQKYYRCMVEDDGPGIPDEMKSKLFHRFQRGTTKAHGKGLGLYLVRTIVDGYGGRVWVEDRVKGYHTKGARFMVMLPAVDN